MLRKGCPKLFILVFKLVTNLQNATITGDNPKLTAMHPVPINPENQKLF